MGETVEDRQAINSKHYLDNGMDDLFKELPAPTVLCEETVEDGVKITVGDERYEIYPKTNRRVFVKRFYEDIEADADKTRILTDPPEQRLPVRVSSLDSSIHDSPTDRQLKETAGQILAFERTTSNPEFWKAVERARRAPTEITFTLPPGHTLNWIEKRRIEKMLKLLCAGNLEKALKYVGKIKTTPPKD